MTPMATTNPVAMTVVRAVAETPGFATDTVADGSYKLIRLAIPKYNLPLASVKMSPRAHNKQYENALTRLRRIGWTRELFDECQQLERQHRIAGTNPDEDYEKALLKALGMDPTADADAAGLPQQRDPVKRHSKATVAGAKPKVEEGATSAPIGEFDALAAPQPIEGAAKVVAEIITPERALDLLVKLAPYQRQLKERKVSDYTAAMLRDEWQLNPADPICIDTNGNTANGQHRLHAVVECMKPQPFYVAYGVHPETYRVMDRGAKRTTADTLYGSGEISTTALAGAAKLAYLWFNVEDQNQWKAVPEVTETQIAHTLEAHPGLRESVRLGRIGGGLKVSPTGAMFIHYLISRRMGGDTRLVTKWYQAMAEMDLERGQPGHSLGLYYLKTSPSAARRTELKGRNKRDLDMYLLVQAWNNTALGKEQRGVSYKPEFIIARPIPPTDNHRFPAVD